MNEGLRTRLVLDDITVVIPTLGRSLLEGCLKSIACGSAWPARLIVVDQSASSIVADWVEALRALGIDAEHVPSSQRGIAAAINRGIERVRTTFLAMTHDDCVVDHNWLQNMTALLRESPESIITGPMDPEGDGPVVTVNTSRTPSIVRRPPLTEEVSYAGNMGTSMSVVQRIGLLDEDPCFAVAAEDCEYSYRALRAGIPFVYAPEVIASHLGWRGTTERAATYRAYGRSLGAFYGKYLRKGDWFIAIRIVIHFLRALRRWLRGIITADHEASVNGRGYAINLLPGIIAGWRSGKAR